MQTKTQSLLESFANVLIGYVVALAAQLIVFPMMGIAVSLGQNLIIGIAFTGVSLVRSYFVRRFFNRIHSWPAN